MTAAPVSESENERECEGKGVRMLKVAGLQLTAQGAVCCSKCESGPIVFREKMSRRQGVCTFPYLYCENYSKVSEIPFLTVGMSRTLAINRRTVFTN